MARIKIALLGAPFTGKTELTSALAEALPRSFGLPEYAREYIEKYGPPEHIVEQMYMLEKMAQIERSIGDLYPYVIIDSPLPVYALYGTHFYQSKTGKKAVEFREEFRKLAVRHANDYDLCYLLPCSEVEYTLKNMDSVRALKPDERNAVGVMLREFCASHVSNYVVLRGSVEDRVKRILEDISKLGL